MNESDLLPCPLCGSKAEFERCVEECCGASVIGVVCTNDECALMYMGIDVEKWNNRVFPNGLIELVKELLDSFIKNAHWAHGEKCDEGCIVNRVQVAINKYKKD